MNNGLEALENLKNANYKVFDNLISTIGVQFEQTLRIIERELKVLKTIKNKQVNIKNLIEYCYNFAISYEKYVDDFNYSDNYFDLGKDLLTENEYDLLNEVLL